ncbi:MAG: hypothetical protein NC221_00695 [Duncaniella sp.]|nr:hypothetical protein [Duncaniella sp.]
MNLFSLNSQPENVGTHHGASSRISQSRSISLKISLASIGRTMVRPYN